MRRIIIGLTAALAVAAPSGAAPSDPVHAQRPSEVATAYVRREAMIAMRDGVRLHTILVMRGGLQHAPMVLVRTPSGAEREAAAAPGPLDRALLEDGYIRAWQDVRGRYGSEGDYITNRPLSGPLNRSAIDHATDAFDTLAWLTANTPESNGRVGVIGGSYAGFTALMASVSGHPALRATVAVNPMVDVWMGDDWFHHGAFRQIMWNVLPIISGRRGGPPANAMVDLTARMLEAGSAAGYLRRNGLDGFPAAQAFLAHPAYDAWWRGRALDRALAARPVRTPMLLVGGLFDEQDQYGAPAVFRALQPHDRAGRVHLLLGPWAHMGVFGDGSALGSLRFEGDTAAQARAAYIKPFLDACLKDRSPPIRLARVTTYATGPGGGWRNEAAIPAPTRALYLHGAGRLDFAPPGPGEPAKDTYLSDPARPVPVTAGPFLFTSKSDSWRTSLVADQRFAATRPDVRSYMTAPLDEPVHVFGRPAVELFAATSGTDSDFVVKLIDVHPDGVQQPLAMDIFRGRYRHRLDHPVPMAPGRTEAFRFALPMADHIVARGHRLMVQVQSSWFPVYDRNPQTFVENIMTARPEDYRVATQTLVHTTTQPSAVWLPIARD
jgi:putative CocE/NonD family hydrolase